MTRLISPDGQCRGVDVGKKRYDGVRIDVTDRQHVSWLKQAGYVEPGLGGVNRASGYTCPTCGFKGWFRTCGRCQAAAVKS